jgi:hypothetical protein
MAFVLTATALEGYGLAGTHDMKGNGTPSTMDGDEDDAESVSSMDMSSSDSDFELTEDEPSFSGDHDFCPDDDFCPDGNGLPQLNLFTADQTLLIFDWDDTILPSTWIQRQGLRLDDASKPTLEQRRQLAAYAQYAIRTLRAAKRHGTVVMVTNAERGWIELSCRKFLPSLCPVIESIKILSARAAYEKPGVTLPSMWKSLAFRSEISNFSKPLAPEWDRNIISFGDAMHERHAVFQVTSGMSNCHTKSFKFMEQPALEQLQKEHELIYWCLRHIVQHDGTLDLQVQLS